MDDELMFAISGLAAAAGSSASGSSSSSSSASSSVKRSSMLNFKSVEESCRLLYFGSKQTPAWKRVLLTDPRQRNVVILGAISALEHDRVPRSCVLAALSVLRIFTASATTSTEIPELSNSSSGLDKRLGRVLLRHLAVAAEEEEQAIRSDELLDKFPVPLRTWDVAAIVLRHFSAYSVFPSVAASIREEVALSSERISTVVAFVRYQFLANHAERAVKRGGPPGSSVFLQLLGLNLIESLSFSCTPNSVVFGQSLSEVVLEATKHEGTRETALKAMVNLSNHCPEAAQALVANGVVDHVMVCMRRYLGTHFSASSLTDSMDVSELDSKDFDGVLICLGLLGNLVEYPESGASAAVLPPKASDEYLKFLCEVYASSLPVRARQSLINGSATDTVEFGWTPEALIMSSHVCLVLGCLVRDSKDAAEAVLRWIPGGKQRGFSPLIQVLQGFLDFQADAGVLTEENETIVREVASHFTQANARSMLPPSSLIPIRPARDAKKKSRTAEGPY